MYPQIKQYSVSLSQKVKSSNWTQNKTKAQQIKLNIFKLKRNPDNYK